MKNRIFETCFSFLALYLLACGFAAIVFIGMLLIPFAFMAIFVLAIREIIIWKRNKNLPVEKRKARKEIATKKTGEGIIRYMHNLDSNERVA